MLNVWSIYSDVELKSIRKSQKTINLKEKLRSDK